MIVVMKADCTDVQVQEVISRLEQAGLGVNVSRGVERTVIGVVGSVQSRPEMRNMLVLLPGVQEVIPISKPYKLTSREFQPTDTVVEVGGIRIGDGSVVVMAGPCAVESQEQLLDTARAVKAAGASILRGGAFKPSTSPYNFRGLGREGLELLAEARAETGMPIITEVLSVRDVGLVAEFADILQIGARNMQNFTLLDEVGMTRKPVMLKRGLSATIQEWLLSAEYILSQGNRQVILCERGIRTFETYTRNTMDISAIPAVKHLSHLPIIGDPSHGTGQAHLVTPLALAAVAAGADGIMVEVHPNPERALKDGPQSLNFESFERLMSLLRNIAAGMGRKIASAAAPAR
ncbi:MAG: 3-deoxy-7-phosphoheptulonate synthase [Chloroflexota bacterium]